MADESEQKVDETLKNAEGKNSCPIHCAYCPSKILNAGAASFTEILFPLPPVQCTKDEVHKREKINEYWMVKDITHFENIGVSHKVKDVKYLVCADCERGPVGWQDTVSFLSYIALSRVKHEKVAS